MSKELRDARILVLGGTGFLGSRIVRKLCRVGASPHLLMRSPERAARIADLANCCSCHTADITDLDGLRKVIDRVRPDIIVYAAGHGSRAGQDDRHEQFRGNLLATHNLLIATESVPECRIVYTGTSLEQGKRAHRLIENGAADPVSYYAATKSAALTLVRQAARHENRPIAILTPFAIYGPGEPAKRLIPTAIRAGLDGTRLHLTQPGFVRDFVYVDDVADAYLAAAVSPRCLGEDVHIAGGEMVSNEAVVALIEKHLGQAIDKQTGSYPPRSTDTTFWRADIGKAKELLGWAPRHSLSDGIGKTVAWFRAHGFHD